MIVDTLFLVVRVAGEVHKVYPLGGPDNQDRVVAVHYPVTYTEEPSAANNWDFDRPLKPTFTIDELKAAAKGWGQSTINSVVQQYMRGQPVCIEGEAWDLPSKLGVVTLQTITRKVKIT